MEVSGRQAPDVNPNDQFYKPVHLAASDHLQLLKDDVWQAGARQHDLPATSQRHVQQYDPLHGRFHPSSLAADQLTDLAVNEKTNVEYRGDFRLCGDAISSRPYDNPVGRRGVLLPWSWPGLCNINNSSKSDVQPDTSQANYGQWGHVIYGKLFDPRRTFPGLGHVYSKQPPARNTVYRCRKEPPTFGYLDPSAMMSEYLHNYRSFLQDMRLGMCRGKNYDHVIRDGRRYAELPPYGHPLYRAQYQHIPPVTKYVPQQQLDLTYQRQFCPQQQQPRLVQYQQPPTPPPPQQQLQQQVPDVSPGLWSVLSEITCPQPRDLQIEFSRMMYTVTSPRMREIWADKPTQAVLPHSVRGEMVDTTQCTADGCSTVAKTSSSSTLTEEKDNEDYIDDILAMAGGVDVTGHPDDGGSEHAPYKIRSEMNERMAAGCAESTASDCRYRATNDEGYLQKTAFRQSPHPIDRYVDVRAHMGEWWGGPKNYGDGFEQMTKENDDEDDDIASLIDSARLEMQMEEEEEEEANQRLQMMLCQQQESGGPVLQADRQAEVCSSLPGPCQLARARQNAADFQLARQTAEDFTNFDSRISKASEESNEQTQTSSAKDGPNNVQKQVMKHYQHYETEVSEETEENADSNFESERQIRFVLRRSTVNHHLSQDLQQSPVTAAESILNRPGYGWQGGGRRLYQLAQTNVTETTSDVIVDPVQSAPCDVSTRLSSSHSCPIFMPVETASDDRDQGSFFRARVQADSGDKQCDKARFCNLYGPSAEHSRQTDIKEQHMNTHISLQSHVNTHTSSLSRPDNTDHSFTFDSPNILKNHTGKIRILGSKAYAEAYPDACGPNPAASKIEQNKDSSGVSGEEDGRGGKFEGGWHKDGKKPVVVSVRPLSHAARRSSHSYLTQRHSSRHRHPQGKLHTNRHRQGPHQESRGSEGDGGKPSEVSQATRTPGTVSSDQRKKASEICATQSAHETQSIRDLAADLDPQGQRRSASESDVLGTVENRRAVPSSTGQNSGAGDTTSTAVSTVLTSLCSSGTWCSFPDAYQESFAKGASKTGGDPDNSLDPRSCWGRRQGQPESADHSSAASNFALSRLPTPVSIWNRADGQRQEDYLGNRWGMTSDKGQPVGRSDLAAGNVGSESMNTGSIKRLEAADWGVRPVCASSGSVNTVNTGLNASGQPDLGGGWRLARRTQDTTDQTLKSPLQPSRPQVTGFPSAPNLRSQFLEKAHSETNFMGRSFTSNEGTSNTSSTACDDGSSSCSYLRDKRRKRTHSNKPDDSLEQVEAGLRDLKLKAVEASELESEPPRHVAKISADNRTERRPDTCTRTQGGTFSAPLCASKGISSSAGETSCRCPEVGGSEREASFAQRIACSSYPQSDDHTTDSWGSVSSAQTDKIWNLFSASDQSSSSLLMTTWRRGALSQTNSEQPSLPPHSQYAPCTDAVAQRQCSTSYHTASGTSDKTIICTCHGSFQQTSGSQFSTKTTTAGADGPVFSAASQPDSARAGDVRAHESRAKNDWIPLSSLICPCEHRDSPEKTDHTDASDSRKVKLDSDDKSQTKASWRYGYQDSTTPADIASSITSQTASSTASISNADVMPAAHADFSSVSSGAYSAEASGSCVTSLASSTTQQGHKSAHKERILEEISAWFTDNNPRAPPTGRKADNPGSDSRQCIPVRISQRDSEVYSKGHRLDDACQEYGGLEGGEVCSARYRTFPPPPDPSSSLPSARGSTLKIFGPSAYCRADDGCDISSRSGDDTKGQDVSGYRAKSSSTVKTRAALDSDSSRGGRLFSEVARAGVVSGGTPDPASALGTLLNRRTPDPAPAVGASLSRRTPDPAPALGASMNRRTPEPGAPALVTRSDAKTGSSKAVDSASTPYPIRTDYLCNQHLIPEQFRKLIVPDMEKMMQLGRDISMDGSGGVPSPAAARPDIKTAVKTDALAGGSRFIAGSGYAYRSDAAKTKDGSGTSFVASQELEAKHGECTISQCSQPETAGGFHITAEELFANYEAAVMGARKVTATRLQTTTKVEVPTAEDVKLDMPVVKEVQNTVPRTQGTPAGAYASSATATTTTKASAGVRQRNQPTGAKIPVQSGRVAAMDPKGQQPVIQGATGIGARAGDARRASPALAPSPAAPTSQQGAQPSSAPGSKGREQMMAAAAYYANTRLNDVMTYASINIPGLPRIPILSPQAAAQNAFMLKTNSMQPCLQPNLSVPPPGFIPLMPVPTGPAFHHHHHHHHGHGTAYPMGPYFSPGVFHHTPNFIAMTPHPSPATFMQQTKVNICANVNINSSVSATFNVSSAASSQRPDLHSHNPAFALNRATSSTSATTTTTAATANGSVTAAGTSDPNRKYGEPRLFSKIASSGWVQPGVMKVPPNLTQIPVGGQKVDNSTLSGNGAEGGQRNQGNLSCRNESELAAGGVRYEGEGRGGGSAGGGRGHQDKTRGGGSGGQNDNGARQRGSNTDNLIRVFPPRL